MAYVPNSNSVVAFQSDPTKLVATVSVVGNIFVGGSILTAGSGSVAAYLQSTNASVITVGGGTTGNSSVQVVGQLPPQSVSGVGTFNIDPVGSGSIITKLTNSSVTTLQGTNPWITQPTSGSVFSYQAPGSIMAVSATVNTGNSSVQLLGGNAAIGSVTALQGTNPWTIQPTSGSVFSYQAPGSIMAVSATVNTGNSSVQLVNGSAMIGSVTAYQGVANWSIGNSSVMILSGTNMIGSVATYQAGVWNTSVWGNVSVLGTVPVTQAGVWAVSVVGVASVTQAGAWNVGLIAPSIVGTYAEDAPSTDGDKGLFVLGVRNDAVASFTSANLDYTPHGVDSAGRMLIQPFAPFQASIYGHSSTVNSGDIASVVVIAAAATGLKNYITDYQVTNTGATATLITFTEGGASILGKTIAPAGGGSNMPGMNFPMKNQRTAQPINMVVANPSSTIHVTMYGFTAP